MLQVPRWLDRWRLSLLADELGWGPLVSLIYLGFLFMPLLFFKSIDHWLLPTVATIPAFLFLYLRALRQVGDRILPYAIAVMGLGYALTPINPNANVYLIFAAALLPFVRRGLSASIFGVLLMMAVYLVEILWLNISLVAFFVAFVVSFASVFANHFYFQNERKSAALRLSHDEVRRLAATAERERIGRDLHDLLGHTLSLIALKSELASRLCERDATAARSEIDQVQRIARDALAQVRHAVTGIRSAGIAAELASARLLLESEGVAMSYEAVDLVLPAESETILALVIREAITNVHRHARASRVRIEVRHEDNGIRLRIDDNGCGAKLNPGTGLSGMRERVEAAGGSLRIESTRGEGVHLDVSLPLPVLSADIVAMPQRSHTS